LEVSVNELELMKQAWEAKNKSIDDIQKQKQEFTQSLVDKAAPADDVVGPVAFITVRYRDPSTGHDRTTIVPSRVLLKSDERMLVWNVALATLGMAWNSAPATAREEAYTLAVCRVQWDRDPNVAEWFKEAYSNDAEFAESLALEVGAHAELYFRGNRGASDAPARQRFVVTRSAVPTEATGM
jgi:hypothetical protein